ncbi:hypothetical protein [Methylobacterium sp. J-077]|uniref:hypothetical protein n=1 Tax=Methylobacterium sp. J-077 TaxID=2836656 RepID=UPI001FBAF417|nr:hypothetical protein [Methylobacterium sp. J-077]MCJ2121169.1 hypothetical protein [Methylobacterium sp. J-077]
MPDSIDWVRQLNRKVLDGLDARETQIVAREAEARKILEACEAERSRIKKQRDGVLETENLQLTVLQDGTLGGSKLYGPPIPQLRSEEILASESSDGGPSRKRRARVGPQRYLMLVALREGGDLSHDEIEKWTGLPAKRVREQIKLDVEQNVVEEVEGDDPRIPEFALSDIGLDLLNRYEEYKRRKSEPLPTLADVRDDGLDEGSVEEVPAQSFGPYDLDDDTIPVPPQNPVFN